MSWKPRTEGLNFSLAGILWNHMGTWAFGFECLYSAKGKRQTDLLGPGQCLCSLVPNLALLSKGSPSRLNISCRFNRKSRTLMSGNFQVPNSRFEMISTGTNTFWSHPLFQFTCTRAKSKGDSAVYSLGLGLAPDFQMLGLAILDTTSSQFPCLVTQCQEGLERCLTFSTCLANLEKQQRFSCLRRLKCKTQNH